MAKKKEIKGIIPTDTPPAEPVAVEPVSIVEVPAIAPDKLVRVRNAGAPFVCDLSGYGYGQRWPTNAVYSIPIKAYKKLLEDGLDGVAA